MAIDSRRGGSRILALQPLQKTRHELRTRSLAGLVAEPDNGPQATQQHQRCESSVCCAKQTGLLPLDNIFSVTSIDTARAFHGNGMSEL